MGCLLFMFTKQSSMMTIATLGNVASCNMWPSVAYLGMLLEEVPSDDAYH